MSVPSEAITVLAVGIATGIAGTFGALRIRRPSHGKSETGQSYELGRIHEQERSDRIIQADQIHRDLERLEEALNWQTRVIERALQDHQMRGKD